MLVFLAVPARFRHSPKPVSGFKTALEAEIKPGLKESFLDPPPGGRGHQRSRAIIRASSVGSLSRPLDLVQVSSLEIVRGGSKARIRLYRRLLPQLTRPLQRFNRILHQHQRIHIPPHPHFWVRVLQAVGETEQGATILDRLSCKPNTHLQLSRVRSRLVKDEVHLRPSLIQGLFEPIFENLLLFSGLLRHGSLHYSTVT